MKLHQALLLTGLLATNTTNGAVGLLTGDSNNEIHSRDSFIYDLSSDGKKVLFLSGPPASGSTPGITSGGFYIRDLSLNELTYTGAGNVGADGSISDDGRYIAWSSPDNMIYWRDIQSDDTRLITPGANGASRNPIISANGRYVAYASIARNLVGTTSLLPAQNRAAVYLYDSVAQTTRIVSLTSTGAALNTGLGAASSVPQFEFDFSADGQYIVFSSDASNAHPSRSKATSQVWVWLYRRNLQSGVVDVVSKNANGTTPAGSFSTPRVDATGKRIVFSGSFVGLGGGSMLPNGYNNAIGYDLYLKDMQAGTVWWVSKTINGSTPDGAFFTTAINSNGTVVAFGSSGTKFINTDSDSGQSGDSMDIFRANIGSAGAVTTTLITKAVVGTGNVGFLNGPWVPGSGKYVAFNTRYFYSLLGQANDNYLFKHGVGVGILPAAANTNRYLLTTTLSPSDSGSVSVSPSSEDNRHRYDTTVTLTATPAEGYRFLRWSGAVTSKVSTASLIITGDTTVTAIFTNLPRYQLNVLAHPSFDVGAIYLDPAPPEGGYISNTVVTATAVAADTNVFSIWYGAASSFSNQITIVMNQHKTLGALFNNPGKLVLQDAAGRSQLWFLEGTNRIAATALRNGATSPWSILGAGDLNADGEPDLVTQHTDGRVSIMTMQSNLVVSNIVLRSGTALAKVWKFVGVGDFNSDTKNDLLWFHQDTRLLAAWIMNGTTYSTLNKLRNGTAATAGWRPVGVGDFNSDNKADVVFQQTLTGKLAMWLMNDSTLLRNILLRGGTPPPTGWNAIGVGDFTDDGNKDILLMKPRRQIAAWQMSTTNYLGTISLNGNLPVPTNLVIRAVK